MTQSIPNIPYAILGLHVENFRGIKSTSFLLEKTHRWIFLTGENGYGKTSVLQALAIAIAGYRDFIAFEYGYGTKDLLKKTFSVTVLNTPEGKVERAMDDEFPKGMKIPLTCYGSTRLNVDSYEGTKTKDNSPIQGLFEPSTILQNIEFELSRWSLKKEDDREFKIKYDSTVRVLKQLLPNLKEINIDKKTDQVTYIEKDEENRKYEPVTLSQLAAGYRSVIAMIGDMILRLFKTQPDTFNVSELKGIVIIDELDLHFHPNLQRKLPSLLSKVFPNIQFICSTHSPIPILGAPKYSTFIKVERNQDMGIMIEVLDEIEIKKLTPNTILTSPIFGFTDIMAETHHGNSRVRTEATYDDIKFNDEVQRRLREFAENDTDEFDGMFN